MLKKLPWAFVSAIFAWIPLAFVTTVIAGLVYGTVQQNYRQGANDPQISVAHDLVNYLEQGNDPKTAVSPRPIDISKSRTPFIMIFDDAGKSIISQAQLDGKAPEVPKGVFDFVRAHGEERFTWQPRHDARTAAVAMPFTSNGQKGFVLVGRSLIDIESRESRLTIMVGLAWAVAVAGSLLLIFVLDFARQILIRPSKKTSSRR